MSNGAVVAVAAAAARAAKASGSIVRVKPDDFLSILSRTKQPLVVTARGWVFGTRYQYLTSYKGLTFYTSSRMELTLPNDAEVIHANSIWVPY